MVVGLGNPGKSYAETPHNIGFATLDRLAADLGASWRRSFRFQARVGRAAWGDAPVLLVKPETFMNRSGRAVAGLGRYHRVEPGDVIVVSDDADLDLGRLRIRAQGGSGGHRGLQSILDEWGDDAFARVRVGIGRPEATRDLVAHVLSPGTAEERERLKAMAGWAAEAVKCIISDGAETAMNRFNGRSY
jgi:PTH1 family peptidyl-tRNA hydrolase